MNKKEFHIGDVLSITTGRLVSPRHMEGIYDILSFMTNDELFTHQLSRASKECAPWLLRQFSNLQGITGEDITEENYAEWLEDKVRRFGKTLVVEAIPRDDHDRIDPLKELEDLVGKDRIITL